MQFLDAFDWTLSEEEVSALRRRQFLQKWFPKGAGER